VTLSNIATEVGTPTYIYSLPRILENYERLQRAFAPLDAEVHYSAKANANLSILRTLHEAGAGIDAVSWGEIYRALHVGVAPENIVFAGVGKTPEELKLAAEAGVGWFNIENIEECRLLNDICEAQGKTAQVALRLNPGVKANTHPHIATGHKAAKFGMNETDLQSILAERNAYPHLNISGIHVHVGSQLGDTTATAEGVRLATEIADAYAGIHTINIGGGFPVAYDAGEIPAFQEFATAVEPLLRDRQVILEPGRSIVADAGVLLCRILYTKAQGGIDMYIVDASMTELIRPALYSATHEIVPVNQSANSKPVAVVGPVCESADVLRETVDLPEMKPGDLLAVLDVGAYGMVMASNYNQRLRPAEVVIEADGRNWHISRRRETYEDLLRMEQ